MDDMDGAFSKEYSSREQQFAIMKYVKCVEAVAGIKMLVQAPYGIFR